MDTKIDNYYRDYFGNKRLLPKNLLIFGGTPAPPKVGRPKRNRKAIKAARKQAAKSRRKS